MSVSLHFTSPRIPLHTCTNTTKNQENKWNKSIIVLNKQQAIVMSLAYMYMYKGMHTHTYVVLHVPFCIVHSV